MLTGIDDHSRFVVCAGLMARATTRAVCGHFAAAMRSHGVPQEILTDNGKVFTGRFGRNDAEVLFDRICRENGIDHLLTAPRSPTTTGKIERFHRTLRQEFLTGRVFTDLATAQAELDAWVDSYNRDRPHSALDMATPASRFHAQDAGRRPADDSALLPERHGSDWVTRKVAANGIISVAWQEISCGKHRAGHHVDVHLDGRELADLGRRRTRQDRPTHHRQGGPQEAQRPPRQLNYRSEDGVTDQAKPIRHTSAEPSQAHRTASPQGHRDLPWAPRSGARTRWASRRRRPGSRRDAGPARAGGDRRVAGRHLAA